jgi:PHP family Zn ribbon phosphoesterase
LGREATIFNIDENNLNYNKIISAIRQNKIAGTVEVDPAYGIYHWDGHRNCSFSCSPKETKKLNGICPICHEPLTIGVESRVEDLAEKNRGELYKAENAKKFYKVLPLHEIISLFTGLGLSSKANWEIYNSLIEKFDDEFNILLNISEQDMLKNGIKPRIIELIIKNRNGRIKVKPGFDGVYGVAVLDEQKRLL